MKNNLYHYNKKELKQALCGVGIKRGNIVFSHIGMGFLGYPQEGRNLDSMFDVIFSSFDEVLGKEGTLIVPTFTYSFCDKEVFDVNQSPSKMGFFTEKFRKMAGAKRTRDPLFSVAGIGPKAETLFRDLPLDCFGDNCIYDRLVKAGAFICNIGVGFKYATFVHYVEQLVGVPYRYKKKFRGDIIDGNNRKTLEVIYNVRNAIDDAHTLPDLSRLEKDAEEAGYLKRKNVGRGQVTNISCQRLLELCKKGIKKDPWYLAKGFK